MGATQHETTKARLDRLFTVLKRGKPVSGFCLTAAEATLGLVRLEPTEENPAGNTPEAIERQKSRCPGAWWAKPFDKTDDRVIRCSAPWHPEGLEPAPKQEPVSRATTRRAAAAAAKTDEVAAPAAPAGEATDETCKNGHPRTEENTYYSPKGARVCRACKREAAERFKAKKAQS